MPHFKCVACRIRMYGVGDLEGPGGELCPGCGFRLEPVGELGEIVGPEMAAEGHGSVFTTRGLLVPGR